MQSGVSIVVCCYNSADRLPETLKHIAQQKVEDYILWEVIIVNNHSYDNTVEVARNLWNTYGCTAPFRIVDEPKSGLSHAREKGFAEALYSYVLFCDDDNWLSEVYVQTAYEVMRNDPNLGALGGKSTAACEIPPPFWFKEFQSVYATGSQASASGDIVQVDKSLWGAGIVIRRTAWQQLQQINFISLLQDRTGVQLSSGGDAELCFALRLIGYKLRYEEKLHLQHFIPRQRLTWEYCKKLHRGFGEAAPKLAVYLYCLNHLLPVQHKNLRSYYRNLLQEDINTITASYKRLLFFLVRDLEGEFYICNYTFRWYRAKAIVKSLTHLKKYGQHISRLRECNPAVELLKAV